MRSNNVNLENTKVCNIFASMKTGLRVTMYIIFTLKLYMTGVSVSECTRSQKRVTKKRVAREKKERRGAVVRSS